MGRGKKPEKQLTRGTVEIDIPTPLQLPIQAADIFRSLHNRTIVEDKGLIKKLAKDGFLEKEFFPNIHQSKRITTEKMDKNGKVKNFLRYSGNAHKPIQGKWKSRTEQNLCRYEDGFWKYDNSDLGKFVDHQVPLNYDRKSGEGVADLLSVTEDKSKIYVIEVKGPDNNEHPLRAMFEVLTFWRMMISDEPKDWTDLGKHLCSGNAKDFADRYNKAIEEKGWTTHLSRLPLDATLHPAILLHKGSDVYETLMGKNDEKKDIDENTKRLYGKLLKNLLKYVQCFEYSFKRPNSGKEIIEIKRIENIPPISETEPKIVPKAPAKAPKLAVEASKSRKPRRQARKAPPKH